MGDLTALLTVCNTVLLISVLAILCLGLRDYVRLKQFVRCITTQLS